MKVLLEAYWWFDGPPSGKNVLRSLVSAWAETFPDDEIKLLMPRSRRGEVERVRLDERWPNVRAVYTRAPQHGLAALCAGAGSQAHDLVLTQNFTPLFVQAKRSVFIHDMMFTERPEWFTFAERLYLGAIKLAARRASAIFTSSNSEAQRISRALHYVQAPVVPVGLAMSSEYAAATPMPMSTVHGEFLLSVGRINIRKNIERLVRSLFGAGIINPVRPLVIVGSPDGAQASSPDLDEATRTGAVLWAGAISDGELKWAYQNCSAFIFPSLDEGFGLPVLEALDAGAPIALSDIPAFREFGSVGRFFDPQDDGDIAETIRQLLDQPTSARRVSGADFSWADVVRRLRS